MAIAADDPKLSEFQTRCISDGANVNPVNDTSKNGCFYREEQEEEDRIISSDLLPSPKYTMLEKWIMDQQKKKLLVEQNWVLRQQKSDKKIAACFNTLKVSLHTWLFACSKSFSFF